MTCMYCKHWQVSPNDPFEGECTNSDKFINYWHDYHADYSKQDTIAAGIDGNGFYTGAYFGCVHFNKKETI